MKVEYICHACLLIETEDARIVTDPWFATPAYCDKWYVFPKPVRTDFVNDANAILISHGHEDHLNEPTLKLFPRNAKVFYPYSFFGGAKEYIESMGFSDVKECVTFKKYPIATHTSVTFVINSHDSIMVIESGGKVLVNANDALHSSPEKVIDFYIDALKDKWPKIDMLFCGFGGASYFPNTMHLGGKNDHEIGLVREQLFAHNFCRVVKGLKPALAVPFAADFCLLDDDQRWINEARFPRSRMEEYYQEYFHEDGYDPKIIDMYSGDYLENGVLRAASPYRKQMQNGGIDHLIEAQYGDEIKEKRGKKLITQADAEKLATEIKQNIEQRMTLFPPAKLNRLRFSIRLIDVGENNFYNISFADGMARIDRAAMVDSESLLTMEMSSDVLRYSIGSDWGADVISVGYGAEIHISSKMAAEVDLEKIYMNLLACYPTSADLRKTPFRTLQFLLLNPPRFTTSIRKLKKFHLESENYDRKTWLLKNPDEIRRIYGLPKLDRAFFDKLAVDEVAT